uniref:Uncharacterized protein n=1 Tax=Catagonus wagneri TaxID=51154 RepID=A0A8C3W1W6_9CETA
MAEVQPGASLFPNGVPWLYALFAMLFVFFLFVMFSPILLEIDQRIKKFLLRCRYSLHNAVYKDRENNGVKIDPLERPGEYSLPFTFGFTWPEAGSVSYSHGLCAGQPRTQTQTWTQ